MNDWKTIEGYENLYQVSDVGEVRNSKGHMMKLQPNHRGYLQVVLHKNGKHKSYLVHRLVAMAFIDNSKNYPQVNHIDTNKHNNRVENLEWCSQSQNMKHAFSNGCFANDKARRQEHARRNHSRAMEALKRKVESFSMSGESLGIFESIAEASEKTGTCASKITAVCRGYRKTANKKYWKYV